MDDLPHAEKAQERWDPGIKFPGDLVLLVPFSFYS